ncbi:hypothetical protein, conserved [Eimeria maxima]|uniref:Uncharacterized protein n=1 Tax=Eimeria maxima TaxID=5804 RepID=U6MBW4_EIMMA|nr:hypothetical protein, conserved [Eimeria maxima]CDJ60528.1 hypothetical protein, conserved [Eimeria maxima]
MVLMNGSTKRDVIASLKRQQGERVVTAMRIDLRFFLWGPFMFASQGAPRQQQPVTTPSQCPPSDTKGAPGGPLAGIGGHGWGSHGSLQGPQNPPVAAALEVLQQAQSWSEAAEGWGSVSAAEAEGYLQALSTLADACACAATRETVLLSEGPPWGPSATGGPSRGPPLLHHLFRVFCCVCGLCLADAGLEYGGPPSASGDATGASQGNSADLWISWGPPLLEALKGSTFAGDTLQRVAKLLYVLLSCLCRSPLAAAAASLLQTAIAQQAFCFVATLAAAAAEVEAVRIPPVGATGAAAATSTAATPAAHSSAAASLPSSGTPNSSSSSNNSSNKEPALLLHILGAYEGLLSLPGVAAAARGGPLRCLHKSVQRGAARLLGKAGSLGDAAVAVASWLIYHRLSSSSSSSSGSSGSSSSSSAGEGSFSASNVRHLLALLIAAVRQQLLQPVEQRLSASCLREALQEPCMQLRISSCARDAALAFAAVCLQALQAAAAAAAAAAAETQPTPSTGAAATAAGEEKDKGREAAEHGGDDERALAAARAAAVAAAASRATPIAEMLALLCVSNSSIRAAVACRLTCLPPQQQDTPAAAAAAAAGGAAYGTASSTPLERQTPQQQQQQQQTSPQRGRSSAALSALSLPALLYFAAHGDELGCTYTSAFLECCIRCLDTRSLGQYLSTQQRQEAVAALAANAGLLPAAAAAAARNGRRQPLGLRGASNLCLLAALWEGTETLGAVIDSVCMQPLSAAGEEAAQRGDTALLLQLLHASLDLSACSKGHMPRSLRLLQQTAAALAAGPLGAPQTATEAEEAFLLLHKCCELCLPVSWRAVPPLGSSTFSSNYTTAAAAAGSASAGSAAPATTAAGTPTAGSGAAVGLTNAGDTETSWTCPLVRRLWGLSQSGGVSKESSWLLSCRPLAAALVEETRNRHTELRRLQQNLEEAKNNAVQTAQRLAVTKEAHEMELSRIKEGAERQQRINAAKQQQQAEETLKLREELETEQRRGRELVAEFQRLLDAKEMAIASLKSNLEEGRSLQGPDVSEVSRDLQIQTAINVKQKEEISKQEAAMRVLLQKQQQTASNLREEFGLSASQEAKAQLQVNYEKLQDDNEQQFRQLILVMKALAEQQAENESLKEARMHSAANQQQQLEQQLQQMQQQLQQMAREQESNARGASLRQVSLEEQLRAYQKENESLKASNRSKATTIEQLERRLQAAEEAAAAAKAAAAANNDVLNRMQQELKEKENRLAVISAALRGGP